MQARQASSDTLDAALEYVQLGWHVLPVHSLRNGYCTCGNEHCSSAGKHPLTLHGVLDATADPEEVRLLWQQYPWANVGIATGSVGGIVVLDVDGDDGEAQLRRLEQEHGRLPRTVQSFSGKGRHLYFLCACSVPNRVRVLPGLDVRGDGGYVVAPPSLHSSGKRYTWIVSPAEQAPAPLPGWLAAMLTQPAHPSSTDNGRAFDWQELANEAIPEGKRNDTLTRTAGSLAAHGVSLQAGETLLQALNIARCQPPLPPDEVTRICSSIWRREERKRNGNATVGEMELPEGARVPEGYLVTPKGILRTKGNGDEWRNICPSVLLPVAIVENIERGTQQVRLAHWTGTEWRTFDADRHTLLQTRELPKLSDYGPLLSSLNARDCVEFFQACLADPGLPVLESVSHFGWMDKDRFLPGLADDVQLVPLGEGGRQIASMVQPEGSFEDWKRLVKPLLEHPLARLPLIASFAAPLLQCVGGRSHLLHLWGGSRSGKTALLKAAASVWGSPELAEHSWNATKVAIEQKAALLRHLPLFLDEKQILGDKSEFVQAVVYLLGSGQGRGRGSKSGGLQEFASWRTIAISTGEEPVLEENSMEGLITRTLELQSDWLVPEKDASNLHRQLVYHHGHAGPLLMRSLKGHGIDWSALQLKLYELQERYRDDAMDKVSSHAEFACILALADLLVWQHLFGLTEKKAMQEADRLAKAIFETQPSAEEADQAERHAHLVNGWLLQNEGRFGDNPYESYGWKEETTEGLVYFLTPGAFEKAARDIGVSPRRLRSDLAQQGVILIERDANRVYYQVRRWHKGRRLRVVGICASRFNA